MQLTMYLICLAAGGVSIALSILGVGGFDGGGGATVDAGDAARALSLRQLILGAAFFGLTGTLFTLLRVGPLLTFGFATAWALVAAKGVKSWRDTRKGVKSWQDTRRDKIDAPMGRRGPRQA